MSMSWFTDDDHRDGISIRPHSPAPAQTNAREKNGSTMYRDARRPRRSSHALQELRDYHAALRDVGSPGAHDTGHGPPVPRKPRDSPSLTGKGWRDSRESRDSKTSNHSSPSHPTTAPDTIPHPPPTRPLPPLPRPRLPSQNTIDTSPSLPTPSPSTSDHGTLAGRPSTGASVSTASIRGRGSWTGSVRESRLTPLNLEALAESLASPITIRNLEPEPKATPPPATAQQLQTTTQGIDVVPSKLLSPNDKDRGSVFYIDVSPSSTVLASKQGNQMIRLWDVPQGTLASSVQIRFYVQTQPRSRDYFVRSHAILSETATLIAIATAFGHTLEIWNWARSKKLQTIDDAYRWASSPGDILQANWPPLATYREDRDTIELYPLKRGRTADKPLDKPFGKPRTIDLRLAALPHLPKCPELAYSATAPLLVAAAGPRTPRPGQPPPEHGPMLMAWEVHDDQHGDAAAAASSPASHKPYKLAMPAAHAELSMALPLCLATYGSVAISIWIPAAYRTVEGKGKKGGALLEPVPVTARHVIVWEFSADATWTYAIPDAIACVSPDCRFVAYCDPKAGVAVLDAMTGRELCWLEREEESESVRGSEGSSVFSRVSGGSSEQSRDPHQITELCFSADSNLFYVGNKAGDVLVYEVKMF